MMIIAQATHLIHHLTRQAMTTLTSLATQHHLLIQVQVAQAQSQQEMYLG